jgi:hypothetical protein
MKRKLLSVTVFCILVAGTALAQIASFPFDANVLDANETIITAASASGITFVADPAKGNIALFDGTGGYVTFSNNDVYTFDALTYNLWFQWNNTNANPWWQRVFDFGKASDPAPGNHDVMFVTTYQDGLLKWHIHSVDWTDGVDTILSSKAAIVLGKWYMLTMTQDIDSAKLYLDGVLQQSKASNIKPSALAFDHCYLGKSNWPDNLFQGKFDDFKIWNSVLSASEIAAMYSPVSAIKLNKIEGVLIYSNNNMISIALPEDAIDVSLDIYNMLGELVLQRTKINSNTEIGNLVSGAYLVRVSTLNGVSTQKVVIR